MSADSRARTEQQLILLTSPGSSLARDSPRATANYYTKLDRTRRTFHRNLVEEYTADNAELGHDGSAALITAGPPGAGKSTEVEKLGLTGYRVIDPDKIKETLLERACEDGIYDDLLKQRLADGRQILPNELATLVHEESADLANEVLRRSLEDGVNVAIEGTFSWPTLKERYLTWLIAGDYRLLTVVNVEVDCATAKNRANDRWWSGREDAFAGTGSWLGGRFTPPAAIDGMFSVDRQGVSACNANAVALFNDPLASHFDELSLYVFHHMSVEEVPDVYVARRGIVQDERPTPLRSAAVGEQGGQTPATLTD